MNVIPGSVLIENYVFRNKYGDRIIDLASVLTLQRQGEDLYKAATREEREAIRAAEHIIETLYQRRNQK